MDLIGPVSLTYYKNIKINEEDERNILLLGDIHNTLEFSKKCCNHNEITNKLQTYGHIVKKIFDSMMMGINLLFFPDAIGTEREDNYVYGLRNVYDRTISFRNEIIQLLNEFEESKGKITSNFKKLHEIAQTKCNESINRNLIKLKTLIESKNEKLCVIENEFLYNLTKQHNCVDIYYESRNADTPFSVTNNMADYISYSEYLFYITKFLPKYESLFSFKFNQDIYSNVRFHESDVRLINNNNIDVDYHLFKGVYPSIIKNVKIITFKEILIYKLGYLDFIKTCLKGGEKNDFTLLRTKNASYNNLFVDFGKYTQSEILHIIKKIYKQYSKSIFYDYNIDVLFDIIKQQYTDEFLFHRNKRNLNVENKNFTNQQLDDIYIDISMVEADIYTIFRMFIKKGNWKIEKHQLKPSNICSKLSYPKNIIVKFGELHIYFFKKFIESYFSLTIDERNNKKINGGDKELDDNTNKISKLQFSSTNDEHNNKKIINDANTVKPTFSFSEQNILNFNNAERCIHLTTENYNSIFN